MSSHGVSFKRSTESLEWDSRIGANLKQAFIAAAEIRRRKTKSGKRNAILKWCGIMKEVLS